MMKTRNGRGKEALRAGMRDVGKLDFTARSSSSGNDVRMSRSPGPG
jgi:hypothetical protein